MIGDKIELILTKSILVLCRVLLLCSLRLLRWLEAAGKLRSFLLDLPDLDLQRPLPQLHLAYLQLHLHDRRLLDGGRLPLDEGCVLLLLRLLLPLL